MYTDQDKQAIKDAIMALVNGERVVSVTVRGRTTQYSAVQLPELRSLAAEMAVQSAAGRPRVIRVAPRSDRR